MLVINLDRIYETRQPIGAEPCSLFGCVQYELSGTCPHMTAADMGLPWARCPLPYKRTMSPGNPGAHDKDEPVRLREVIH